MKGTWLALEKTLTFSSFKVVVNCELNKDIKHSQNSPGDIAVARRWTVFCILFSDNHWSTAYTCTANSWYITHQARFTVCITTAKLSEFSSVGEQTVSNYWGLWERKTGNSLLFIELTFCGDCKNCLNISL